MGQSLVIVATTPDREWLQLDDGTWIASFLVNNPRSDVILSANIPVSLTTATPVPVVIEVPPTASPLLPTGIPVQQQPAQEYYPSYPDLCLQPGIADLNCPDIPWRRFRVYSPYPHRFDGDKDSVGCDRD